MLGACALVSAWWESRHGMGMVLTRACPHCGWSGHVKRGFSPLFVARAASRRANTANYRYAALFSGIRIQSLAPACCAAVAVAASVGAMNLVGGWFGAMPCCMGAGGLAAQVRLRLGGYAWGPFLGQGWHGVTNAGAALPWCPPTASLIAIQQCANEPYH